MGESRSPRSNEARRHNLTESKSRGPQINDCKLRSPANQEAPSRLKQAAPHQPVLYYLHTSGGEQTKVSGGVGQNLERITGQFEHFDGNWNRTPISPGLEDRAVRPAAEFLPAGVLQRRGLLRVDPAFRCTNGPQWRAKRHTSTQATQTMGSHPGFSNAGAQTYDGRD